MISPGLARVVIYAPASEEIANGTGEIASLRFQLRGSANQTALTPSAIVLSDVSGTEVPATGQAGQLTVTGGGGGEGAPDVDIAILKNPGRTRTFQVWVTVVDGSGSTPDLTVGGSSVPLSTVSSGVFRATVSAPQTTASLQITASDTNAKGTGTDAVTVTF